MQALSKFRISLMSLQKKQQFISICFNLTLAGGGLRDREFDSMCFGDGYGLWTWRRQWHPTPVLLPGKSHGWRSLVDCMQSMGSPRVRHH